MKVVTYQTTEGRMDLCMKCACNLDWGEAPVVMEGLHEGKCERCTPDNCTETCAHVAECEHVCRGYDRR